MDSNVVTRLVYSMIQFLKSQLESSGASSLTEEGAESVEVAVQCLETAFGISSESTHLGVSRNLYDIYQEAVKDEVSKGIYPNLQSEPNPEDKDEAERLKNEGNQMMRDEKFDKALECYTKAIGKDRTNAVYFCNRAAAHSKLNNHFEAIEDCKRALRIEPLYGKAYGRMGLAYSALDKALEAKDCYQKALELEPDNDSYRGNLQIAEEKLRTQSQQSSNNANPNPFATLSGGGGFNLGPLGSLAGLASGGPGGQDIQGLFNNPTLMNMATQLMSDPNMQNMMTSLLGNFAGVAPRAGGGGGGGGGGVGVGGQVPPNFPPFNTETPPSNGTSGGGGGGTGGTGTATPPGMEALLSAGRQLAEQMQAQHPDLVEQLRSQMNRPPGPNQDGDPQNPQPPPQS